MMDFRGRLMPWQQLDTPTTVISPAISPAPRDGWEVVLRSDPLALESQSPAWTDAACAAGRFEDAEPGPDPWGFTCECGARDCRAPVSLTLAAYDALRQADRPLLAPGHDRLDRPDRSLATA